MNALMIKGRGTVTRFLSLFRSPDRLQPGAFVFAGGVGVGFLFGRHDLGADVQLVAVEGVAWRE